MWPPTCTAPAASVCLLKRLLQASHFDENTLTVTGKTLAEEGESAVETPGQEVIAPLDKPLKKTGGLVILHGNLAPEGCVAKISGHERLSHRGPARVFESEEDAMTAVTAKRIKAGDVVVIRNEGPKGRPWDARDAERHRQRSSAKAWADRSLC